MHWPIFYAEVDRMCLVVLQCNNIKEGKTGNKMGIQLKREPYETRYPSTRKWTQSENFTTCSTMRVQVLFSERTPSYHTSLLGQQDTDHADARLTTDRKGHWSWWIQSVCSPWSSHRRVWTSSHNVNRHCLATQDLAINHQVNEHSLTTQDYGQPATKWMDMV